MIKNMYTTQIKLTFTVFGDVFDPLDFTDAIGITCSDMWLKGDVIKTVDSLERGHSTRRRRESAWIYSSDYYTTLNFYDLLVPFEKTFRGKAKLIKDFVSSNDLDTIVNVIVEIANGQAPSLALSKSFINFLNELGSEIDFDIYVLDED